MSTTTFADLQREMAAAVMQPLTPDEDMRRESPDGRPMEEVAASFIAPNSRLDCLRAPGNLQPTILVSRARRACRGFSCAARSHRGARL